MDSFELICFKIDSSCEDKPVKVQGKQDASQEGTAAWGRGAGGFGAVGGAGDGVRPRPGGCPGCEVREEVKEVPTLLTAKGDSGEKSA